jgi:soluble lytic murein transglycosylase-like protein
MTQPTSIQTRKITLIVFAILSFGVSGIQADIFMFIDSQGVLHFTNAPTSSQYTLYIKERPKPAVATTQYDDIIQEASHSYGLSFSLLKAMIRVESNFDSKAVSKKGALGLMQIMPRNLTSLNILDPYDPKDNIMGGARYFKSLIERFDGKLPLALAAYNAGPSIVDKHRDIPPIKETQEYVKKVMKFFYLYKNS